MPKTKVRSPYGALGKDKQIGDCSALEKRRGVKALGSPTLPPSVNKPPSQLMEKIPYLLKRDFFTPEEEASIWDELNFLNNPHLMLEPSLTNGSIDRKNVQRKKNKGIFLDTLYARLDSSSIWRASRKIFTSATMEYSQLHLSNTSVFATNRSSLLVSYYEDSDYYLPHTDEAVVSVLYWFYKEPKTFVGGDLTFNDTGEVVEVRNNTMLMFPSWATHSVSEIMMPEDKQDQKLGRYCLTHFLTC